MTNSALAAGAKRVIHSDALVKHFASVQGKVQALGPLTFDVFEHSFVSIVGPSGCGKSTFLKLVAGLIPATSGNISFKDRQVTGPNTQVGYVPQESQLFFWLTVKGNIEFPLIVRKIPPQQRKELIKEYISMFGLEGFENHYPNQLSGGMAKRVSIIRTMIYDPEIILMDEPFGPLDAQTRMVLQDELLKVWGVRKKTIIFITHDLVEAIALADKILVMTKRPGTIKAVIDVKLERPRNVFAVHEQKGFKETYDELWGVFHSEIGR